MGTAQAQGEVWSGSPRDWAELQEPQFCPLYTAVLESAAIGSHSFVLDVGCGAGFFCHMAAKQGASVAGIDAAAALIEIARERTPEGDFRVGEMEELPFEDGTFDLVTGFNSFQFAADPINALKQARRVTKAGGQVAMAVWGAAKDCEAAAFVRALGTLLPLPPAGAPGPFALSEPGVLEGILSRAGLTPEKSGDADAPFDFANDEMVYRAIVASGPGVRAVRHAGTEAVKAALAPVIAPFKTKSGTYHFNNKFRYVIARA
jgi:SAM-dependent methyltransferase